MVAELKGFGWEVPISRWTMKVQKTKNQVANNFCTGKSTYGRRKRALIVRTVANLTSLTTITLSNFQKFRNFSCIRKWGIGESDYNSSSTRSWRLTPPTIEGARKQFILKQVKWIEAKGYCRIRKTLNKVFMHISHLAFSTTEIMHFL